MRVLPILPALLSFLAFFVGAEPSQGASHGNHKKNSGWTQAPLILSSGGGRGGAVRLQNINSQKITLFPSDLTQESGHDNSWSVTKTQGGYPITLGEKAGGYQWVQARQERGDEVVVGSTVRYFSKPGPAPTQMLTHPKNELEIIPIPLPREHSHYRAGESWPFLIRFNGSPLAGKQITLQSSQGDLLSFVSSDQGMVTVTFPEPFVVDEKKPTTKSGHRPHRPKAFFALSVRHLDGGKNYLTAFNLDYRPGPFFNKSLALGFGFLLFGMVIATPLLRKPQKNRRIS
jgi:hypothetical protein